MNNSAERAIADELPARHPVGMDADHLLDRYRQACADAGIVPLPDAEAARLLAVVMACLDATFADQYAREGLQ